MKVITEEKVIELVKLQNKLLAEVFNNIEQIVKDESFNSGQVQMASVNKILFKIRYLRSETLRAVGAIK